MVLLVWPIAAVYGYPLLAPREDVAVPAVEVSLDPVGQSAGAMAQGFVSAWLGASRKDTENLERYTDAGSKVEVDECEVGGVGEGRTSGRSLASRGLRSLSPLRFAAKAPGGSACASSLTLQDLP
jgi:hypothetical protein